MAESPQDSGLDEDYEELYQHAPCGYLSTTADGVIIRANDTLLRWTGYTRERLIGKCFTELLTMAGKIFHDTHYAPLIQIQGSIKEIAFDVVRSDRTVFPALVNAFARHDADGRIQLIRTTVVDVTDRRSYEKEFLRARQIAEAALMDKDAMLAMLSHDMRSPLTSIMMAADLLTESTSSRYVKVIHDAARTVLVLVNSILERGKLESGTATWNADTFDIRGLVKEIVAILSVKAEVALEVTIDAAIPEFVIGDRFKVGQIVTNLVSNAIKFTPRGSVHIGLRMLDGADIELTVADTGIGIPADKLGSIFDDYQQASEARFGGTGLGLSICRRLAALNGSKIMVTSTLGQGSTFSCVLRLPPARP